ncbi:DNA adenine methylase [Dongia deserti]|uniref:DNA adenine methylase n=1 Tax=Dongia deserti TaxID=2268030 RepID=UPI000E65C7A2|nr:DNA adenine methylase [Dongia deserti]
MKSFREVEPARPVAPYVGGKRNLADRLVKRIERITHSVYAEPFVGMGGVFLRRRSAPAVEIINDRSKDVATLFRVVQRHYVPFTEMIRWQLTTRADFERLSRTDPETLTDLERAARFLYLQRTAFGGKVSGRNFGVSFQHPARFDLARVLPMLEALHERLNGVTIECLPFDAFIARYDRQGTLFFLDPPYWGSEKDYGAELFDRGCFAALAGQLAGIKGRFLAKRAGELIVEGP